ncbi:hypothetical protein GCM10027180_20880 [Microbulbifer echini]
MRILYAVGLMAVGISENWTMLLSEQKKSTGTAIPVIALSRIKGGKLLVQLVYGLAGEELGKSLFSDCRLLWLHYLLGKSSSLN